MTSVCFVYGNHGSSPNQLDDLWNICVQLFKRALNVDLLASERPVPGALNVIVECFDANFNARLRDIKASNPDTRLICIVTEFVTQQTFNQFESGLTVDVRRDIKSRIRLVLGRTISTVINQNIRDFFDSRLRFAYRQGRTIYFSVFGKDAHRLMKTHYEQISYWKNRFENFAEASPLFDFIFIVNDHQLEGYSNAFPNLQIARLPIFQLGEDDCKAASQNPNRDIDFFFSGTLTTHRRRIIEELRDRGFTVVATPANLPECLRANYLRRAKVCLHIKVHPSWPFPSNIRLHQLLSLGKKIVVEQSTFSCWQDQFCRVSGSESFVETCAATVMQEIDETSIRSAYKTQSNAQWETVKGDITKLLLGNERAEPHKDEISKAWI